MKVKKVLCLILAMMMVFTLALPATIYAHEFEFNEYEYYDQDAFYLEEEQNTDDFLYYDEGYAEVEWEEDFSDEIYDYDEEFVSYEESFFDDNDEFIDEDEEFIESLDEEPVTETNGADEQFFTLEISDTAAFETDGAASITGNPENAEPRIGTMVSFTVAADNAKAYQWQYSTDGGQTYADVFLNGYRTPTLSFKLKEAYISYYFRCAVTGYDNVTIYSEGATFEATASGAVITADPANAKATVGSTVSFTVAADNAVKYQWQYSTDGGQTYEDVFLNGYKTATLSFKLKEAYVEYYFRCAVTGSDGVPVYSQGATFVKGAVITANPESVEPQVGSMVSFTVAANNAVKYQWQYSTDGGQTFADVFLNGYKTPTLSFKLKEAYVNYVFRCAVTGEDGVVVYSESATFEAPALPAVITANPENAELQVDSMVSFTVAANNAVKYQWQYSTDGGQTYEDVFLNGYKTPTLSFKLKEAYVEYYFRCAVTGEDGAVVYSESATFVAPALPAVITEQPEDVQGAIGSTVSFTVAADNAVKYQWQYSTDGGQTYEDVFLNGYKTATLSFKLKESYINYYFRCAVTGEDGAVVYSNGATFILDMEDEYGVVYRPLSAATCRVVGYTGNASTLVIGEYFSGMQVIEIGESAFENNTALASIDLPDSIQIIGKRAFANCTNLSTMN